MMNFHNQLHTAVLHYEQALLYHAEYGAALAQLGIALYHLERYADAQLNLQRSIDVVTFSLSPRRVDVKHHLALVQGKLSAQNFIEKYQINKVQDRRALLQLSLEQALSLFTRASDSGNNEDDLSPIDSPIDSKYIFLEFGVFHGDSAKFIAAWLEELDLNINLNAFDSFQGLPEKWQMNSEHPVLGFAPEGTFRVQDPTTLVTRLQGEHSNLKLHVGLFQNTLQLYLDSITGNPIIAFVHIDCDLFSSTKFVLQSLHPYLRKGTIIQFDELIGWPGWPFNGEYRALQDLITATGLQVAYLNTAGQAVTCIVVNV